MKILITGAAGALGRNLVENLKTIRDGKNRTRSNLKIDAIYEYDRNSTEEDLDRFFGLVQDVFGKSGNGNELLDKFELTAPFIVEKAKAAIAKK